MLKKILKEHKDQYHRDCFFNNNHFNLRISFNKKGDLIGKFYCERHFQGYSNRMHGGILSAFLDSAMTQFLFSQKIVGYTVQLNIKYMQPVEIDKYAKIYVKQIEDRNHHFAFLSAEIVQKKIKRVTADAKFWIVNR